jgi:hypothetical protein
LPERLRHEVGSSCTVHRPQRAERLQALSCQPGPKAERRGSLGSRRPPERRPGWHTGTSAPSSIVRAKTLAVAYSWVTHSLCLCRRVRVTIDGNSWVRGVVHKGRFRFERRRMSSPSLPPSARAHRSSAADRDRPAAKARSSRRDPVSTRAFCSYRTFRRCFDSRATAGGTGHDTLGGRSIRDPRAAPVRIGWTQYRSPCSTAR